MVKLEFKRGHYEAMMVAYKSMLTYIKSAVTRNYSEKVINKVLDLVSAPGGMDESRQMELLHDFYETTLSALQVWACLLPTPAILSPNPLRSRCPP